QGHLCHVDPTAAKAALAIHEVIAPQVVERPSKTRQSTIRDGLLVTSTPPFQSFRIIPAEALPVLPCQAAFIGECCKLGLVQKQSTRKDVGLYEVGVLRVALENAVIHADELQRSASPR